MHSKGRVLPRGQRFVLSSVHGEVHWTTEDRRSEDACWHWPSCMAHNRLTMIPEGGAEQVAATFRVPKLNAKAPRTSLWKLATNSQRRANNTPD